MFSGMTLLATLHASAQTRPEPPVLNTSAPLGERSNPVRANNPTGQRDYLMRLRCPGGDAPRFERAGSFGPGPYGGVIDMYDVACASGKAFGIFMDMYHRHREMQAVPGLQLLAEHPGRIAAGCPPKVDGFEAGNYVFNLFEVEQSAHAPGFKSEVEGAAVKGNVFVRMVIGADGRAVPSAFEFPYPDDPKDDGEKLRQQVRDYLTAQQFVAAQHKPGCAVPQRVELVLQFK